MSTSTTPADVARTYPPAPSRLWIVYTVATTSGIRLIAEESSALYYASRGFPVYEVRALEQVGEPSAAPFPSMAYRETATAGKDAAN